MVEVDDDLDPDGVDGRGRGGDVAEHVVDDNNDLKHFNLITD